MELKQFELEDLIKIITREVITVLMDMKISFDGTSLFEDKKIYKAGKELITEKGVEELVSSGFREIQYEKGCIITPLARDRAKELGINIILQ